MAKQVQAGYNASQAAFILSTDARDLTTGAAVNVPRDPGCVRGIFLAAVAP
jgi:hypothetical protein